MKNLFIQYFGPFVTAFVASLHTVNAKGSEAVNWDFASAFKRWDSAFDELLKKLEEKASLVRCLVPALYSCSKFLGRIAKLVYGVGLLGFLQRLLPLPLMTKTMVCECPRHTGNALMSDTACA